MSRRLVLGALLFGCATSPGTAQVIGTGSTPTPPQLSGPLVPGDTVYATPFGRYEAGPLHRLSLGGGHRELWALPVRAPVLDLEGFAGGLTLTGTGGGLQTRSLVFEGADGQEWRFRSIDKDATRTLDPVLRETLAARILQDQIGHLFPLAAMVVDPLLEAAGVLHPRPELVVLPDDARLGEYRESFRGMLGWMEVRPDEGTDERPGFAGSDRVIGSDRLFERLEEDARNRLDAHAFLRARLMDALVGDWDRHPDQWRWAARPRTGPDDPIVFEPVPRDRDWALSRLDGLIARFTWIPWPHYVGFSDRYPPAFRLTWSGRALDRRLLSELDRTAWARVAADLQRRLDDGVIDRAVARLPESYPAEAVEGLARALKARRDALPRFADEYYLLLAGWVDVYATDDDELATAEWHPDDRLAVTVSGEGGRGPVRFRRVFVGTETREVRLYLRGGDDRFEERGSAPSSIGLRVVGGGGDDHLRAETPGGGDVRLYDDRGTNTLTAEAGASIHRSGWTDPVDPLENTHRAGHRDWGARTLLLPAVRFEPDLGLFVGARLDRVVYGFRSYPYQARYGITVAGASGTGRPDLALDADLPLGEGSPLRLLVGARLFGTEFHRFYGLGNDTPSDAGEGYYRAPRRLLGVDAAVAWRPLDGRWSAGLGMSVRGHRPFDQEGTLVEASVPYGAGDFDEIVAEAHLEREARDRPDLPTAGYRWRLAGAFAPRALDVASAYATLEGSTDLHRRAPAGVPWSPVLSVRVGARTTLGDAPYQAAARLGGASSVRGLRAERLAGDLAIFAGSELRLHLGEAMLLLPARWGILGLADAGRVWLDGESPGGWHVAWGGGVWADFLRAFPVSVIVARGPDDTLAYATLGLTF